MTPTPPDPQVEKKTAFPAMLLAVMVVAGALAFVFADPPGAGMGGSLFSAAQSQR